MMTTLHAPLWLVQVVVGLFYVIGLRLSASDLSELEALLAHAVEDAMHVAHIPFKSFAADLGIDEKQLRRQLNREPGQHLSLYRLLRAPLPFWCVFGPTLMALVFKRRWQELRAEADAIRADKPVTTNRTTA